MTEQLKADFGDDLIFYGGCFDAVLYPPTTSDEVVYESVKRNIEIFSDGGGYLFAGVHNLPVQLNLAIPNLSLSDSK